MCKEMSIPVVSVFRLLVYLRPATPVIEFKISHPGSVFPDHQHMRTGYLVRGQPVVVAGDGCCGEGERRQDQEDQDNGEV